jgi:tetrahydromethanopterin S-methyltransferase subunit F
MDMAPFVAGLAAGFLFAFFGWMVGLVMGLLRSASE